MAQQHEPDGDAVHKDKLPPVRLQHVKKDALRGEVCQDFYSVLKKHCGRCHKLDLCLDLRVSDSKNGASPSDTKIGTHVTHFGRTQGRTATDSSGQSTGGQYCDYYVFIFSWEPAL